MSWQPVIVEGHFGEWLQGRMGATGPVALVTVRCPPLRVRAPGADDPPFSRDQLAHFAAQLGSPAQFPGATCNAPLGGGAGASTATLIALARAAGITASAEALAAACLAVEGASDPLMFPQPDTLLWASREGRILRRMPPPPTCQILGGFWGRPHRTDPGDMDFDDITDLAAAWAEAVQLRDLRRCATLASTSAQRCTERRGPPPYLTPDPTPDLARDLGALGWLRAHTGSARGLIFAPGTVPRDGAGALAEAEFSGVISFRTGGA
ncbi:propanediol utilization protein [Alloyangia pacifica]|uniref:propanediol utilization protein n=1 Tax=Alloyangia pacifica TaxID=311180 RepID=UPI001CFD4740|nr:propanediol utilization protein [Alloyangia pacifica]